MAHRAADGERCISGSATGTRTVVEPVEGRLLPQSTLPGSH